MIGGNVEAEAKDGREGAGVRGCDMFDNEEGSANKEEEDGGK